LFASQSRVHKTDRHLDTTLKVQHKFLKLGRSRFAYAIILFLLAGCQFESSITPIVWSTVAPQRFQQATIDPQASPVPLAPTPVPPPPIFRGIDSLDCSEPMSGDNHYRYCRIPGTMEFHAWGECTAECPDGPYPGIQIVTVSEAESALYRDVIDGRDDSIAERRTGFGRGGILGGAGVGLGVPAIGAACIGAGGWNFGTGCVLVLAALAVDAWLVGADVKDAIDAHSDLTRENGFEDSAQDLFEQLGEDDSTDSGSPP